MSRVLPRTQFGNPILRTPAKAVPVASVKTASFKTLVKSMFYTMHRTHGVGLAAPQIGRPLQLAVIGARTISLRRVIVNPRITWHSKNTLPDWEGCLSFPDARGQVPRWAAIRIKYMDEVGKWVEEKHTGFAARIFQHEIDHLNGTLYVDRMPDMRTLMSHKEFIKRVVR